MDDDTPIRPSLRGARILIVEDEFFLADDLAAALREAGAEVLGPAGTVAEAESLVDGAAFDCAIVDMNLRGDMAYPIADRLLAAGIPFLITTGYDGGALPERYAGMPRIEKPSDTRKLVKALPALLASHA